MSVCICPTCYLERQRCPAPSARFRRELVEQWYEASFIRNIAEDGQSFSAHDTRGISGAQGLWMCCPCGDGHAIIVPFSNPRNAPDVPSAFGPWNRTHTERPRWAVSGNSLLDLTILPSIDLDCWHGFITAGVVEKVGT